MEQSQPQSARGRGRGLRLSNQQKLPVPPPPGPTPSPIPSNDQVRKPVELGKLGRPVEVLVNYFAMLQFPQQGFVYRYDIQMSSKKGFTIRRALRRQLYRSWLRQLSEHHESIDVRRIVFDNQTAVFTYDQQLPGVGANETKIAIAGPNRTKCHENYEITVKQVGKPINLNLLKLLRGSHAEENDLVYIRQMLGLVLHEYCSEEAGFIYGRTFFRQPQPGDQHGNWNLGSGKAIWRGFYSCLVFANGQHQLLVNIDVSHGMFLVKQSFLTFLSEVMRQRLPKGGYSSSVLDDVAGCLSPHGKGNRHVEEREFLLKHCRQLRVTWQPNHTLYTAEIAGLGESASEETFHWKYRNNQLVSIVDYYRSQYGYTLKYPLLPVLKLRNGLAVPMEIVDVEPMKIRRITDEQRAQLTRNSTLKPDRYRRAVDEVSNKLHQCSFKENSIAAAWNLSMSTDMHKITARVLPAPTSISANQPSDLKRAYSETFHPSTRDAKFYQPAKFPDVWAMINLSSLDQECCETFSCDLGNAANKAGISYRHPDIYNECNAQVNSLDSIIHCLETTQQKNPDCTFFLVILPENRKGRGFDTERLYGEVKKLCEIETGRGIVTQMVRASSIRKPGSSHSRCLPATLDKIILKMNAKLSGINFAFVFPPAIERFFARAQRIMYVGVDLCHPPAGSPDPRSIVAVVASTDSVPNQYFKEIYIQNRPSGSNRKTRIAYVVKMKEIMVSLITKYYHKHELQPPTAIVIYRDGISDGEFVSVLEKELTGTREACMQLSSSYQPALTYVVVNKKDHTRMFQSNSEKNVDAGTVIDSHDITNAATYDFFLKGHGYHMGTSHPIHYHVLSDDNNFKPDEIQMLTYALCYNYVRCTLPISVPAPVRYANLLSERAKHYLSDGEGLVGRTADDNDISVPIRLNPNLPSEVLFFV